MSTFTSKSFEIFDKDSADKIWSKKDKEIKVSPLMPIKIDKRNIAGLAQLLGSEICVDISHHLIHPLTRFPNNSQCFRWLFWQYFWMVFGRFLEQSVWQLFRQSFWHYFRIEVALILQQIMIYKHEIINFSILCPHTHCMYI